MTHSENSVMGIRHNVYNLKHNEAHIQTQSAYKNAVKISIQKKSQIHIPRKITIKMQSQWSKKRIDTVCMCSCSTMEEQLQKSIPMHGTWYTACHKQIKNIFLITYSDCAKFPDPITYLYTTQIIVCLDFLNLVIKFEANKNKLLTKTLSQVMSEAGREDCLDKLTVFASRINI